MARMLLLVILLLGGCGAQTTPPTGSPSPAPASGWVTWSPPDGRFQVELPAAPQPGVEYRQGIRVDTASVQGLLVSERGLLPSDKSLTVEQIRAAPMRQAGSILSVQSIHSGGAPGVEGRVQPSSGAPVRMRVFLLSRKEPLRLCVLTAPETPEGRRFLDSFRPVE